MDPDLVKPLPDQSGSVFRVRFVAYGQTGFFQSIFSSLISGIGVLISYRTSDINGNKTRLIGIKLTRFRSGIWYKPNKLVNDVKRQGSRTIAVKGPTEL